MNLAGAQLLVSHVVAQAVKDYLQLREQECARDFEPTGKEPRRKAGDEWPKTMADVSESCAFFRDGRLNYLLDLAALDAMPCRIRRAVNNMDPRAFKKAWDGVIDGLPTTLRDTPAN